MIISEQQMEAEYRPNSKRLAPPKKRGRAYLSLSSSYLILHTSSGLLPPSFHFQLAMRTEMILETNSHGNANA